MLELDSATEKAMKSAHLVGDIVVERYLLSDRLNVQGYVLFWKLFHRGWLKVRPKL
jgi:hypothetical protein